MSEEKLRVSAGAKPSREQINEISTLCGDSSAPLMHHDQSDLASLILIRIISYSENKLLHVNWYCCYIHVQNFIDFIPLSKVVFSPSSYGLGLQHRSP